MTWNTWSGFKAVFSLLNGRVKDSSTLENSVSPVMSVILCVNICWMASIACCLQHLFFIVNVGIIKILRGNSVDSWQAADHAKLSKQDHVISLSCRVVPYSVHQNFKTFCWFLLAISLSSYWHSVPESKCVLSFSSATKYFLSSRQSSNK